MRKRLEPFDANRDRDDPKKAAELFELLWPEPNIRLACAERLARSIRHAHKQAGASWEITMFDWGVRLNVGQVAVLDVDSDELRLYERSLRGSSIYKAVRVPSRRNKYAISEVRRLPSKTWDAHLQFISAAAKAKKVSPFKDSFSEGALRYLESMIRTTLPRPSYLTRRSRDQRYSSVEPHISAKKLHILQGGIDNGDKDWLEKAARRELNAPSWVVPKSVSIGDEVVIYVTGHGLFATARIKSRAKPKANWSRRYGAPLEAIELIKPPISLAAIRQNLPELEWANYPRSITTPSPEMASRLRRLIARRRKSGLLDLDDSALDDANLDELRELALMSAQPSAKQIKRVGSYRLRSQRIHAYVLRRANGHCESCKVRAPFVKADGSPYLEPHHTIRVADDGPDHPATVIGLCPNCHRRVHSAHDAKQYNRLLIKKLSRLEPRQR
jgi:predicted HNH restriction endonuclease